MIKLRSKKTLSLIALISVLAFVPMIGAGIAAAADPVKLTVHDPTGGNEVSELFAARLDNLHGKTICELSNVTWEAHRTFPALREALQNRYPTAKIIDFTKMPLFNERSTPADLVKVAAAVKAAGCDAAILGNAG
ncbi:MAG: hypothetical protein FWE89_02705 [Syntrophaceae bacterium]|nr:hypothetical protein [Syntrophaceae bacterium]